MTQGWTLGADTIRGPQAVGANLPTPPDGAVETVDDVVAEPKEFAKGADGARTSWVLGTAPGRPEEIA